MVRIQRHIVWLVVACATVVAQVSPKSLCQACDQPCCAEWAGGHDLPAAGARIDTETTCPRCAAAADSRPAETDGRPCHCQLKSRHEQPLAPTRGTLFDVNQGDAVFGPAMAPPDMPHVLGVSREYLAASLAVPIRPARILFGVWRN